MKHLKNKQGNAMVMTIILLMIVTILGTAMLASITREVKVNRTVEEKAVARYLAQAGIDHALYLIEIDNGSMQYPYLKEVTLEANSRVYVISIYKDGQTIKISSSGKLEENGTLKQQVTLEAAIDEAGNVVVK